MLGRIRTAFTSVLLKVLRDAIVEVVEDAVVKGDIEEIVGDFLAGML